MHKKRKLFHHRSVTRLLRICFLHNSGWCVSCWRNVWEHLFDSVIPTISTHVAWFPLASSPCWLVMACMSPFFLLDSGVLEDNALLGIVGKLCFYPGQNWAMATSKFRLLHVVWRRFSSTTLTMNFRKHTKYIWRMEHTQLCSYLR